MSLPPSCYLGDHRIIMKPTFGGKLIVPSTDLSIMPDLILSGHIEAELCNWIRQNVKPGFLCLDVGGISDLLPCCWGFWEPRFKFGKPIPLLCFSRQWCEKWLNAKLFKCGRWSKRPSSSYIRRSVCGIRQMKDADGPT